MSDQELTICPNCKFEDKGNFCSKCGFKFQKKKVETSNLLMSSVDYMYNFDFKYFNTVKILCTRPFEFIEGYLKGNRREYYIPVKYLLFNAGIYLLVFKYFKFDDHSDDPDDLDLFSETVIQSEIAYTNFIDSYGQFLTIAVIPLFVVISMLLNRKTKYSFSERAVAIMYLFGHFILLETIINFISGFNATVHQLRPWIIRCIELSAIVLLNFRLFKEGYVHTIWKSAVTVAFIFIGMYSLLASVDYIIKMIYD